MSAWTPIIVPFVVGFISFILVEVYKARKAKKSEPNSLKSAKILNDREVLTKFMGLPSAEADELLNRQTVARQAAAEKPRKEAALKLDAAIIAEAIKTPSGSLASAIVAEFESAKQAEVARANAWNARHKELSYKLYINEITQKQYDDLVALHKVEEALQAGFDAVDKWEYLSKGDNIALGADLRREPKPVEERWIPPTSDECPHIPIRPAEGLKEQAEGRRDRVGSMWSEAAKSHPITQDEWEKIRGLRQNPQKNPPEREDFHASKMGKVVLRILPPAHGNSSIFSSSRLHYIHQNGTPPVKCGKDVKGVGSCPICDLHKSLWDKADKTTNSWAARDLQNNARLLKPAERYYYNCIVREGDSTAQPKILAVGKQVHKKIIQSIVGGDEQHPPLGDITHPTTGRDFVMMKSMVNTGYAQYPDYKIQFLEPSPLGTKDEVLAIMAGTHDLSKTTDRSNKTQEELAKIAREYEWQKA